MVRKKLPDDCMPKCASCAFFVCEPKDEMGECRRLPPLACVADDQGVMFAFAVVHHTEWCGEFKRRVS